MERKKQGDSVLDNPLRRPANPGSGVTTSGGGSGVNPSVTTQRVQGATENLGNMKQFRCSDVGFKDCKWQAQGRSEEELMPQIERHGREAHNIQHLDDNTRNRVRNSIRDIAA
jgi:predicted small metal-binding protein